MKFTKIFPKNINTKGGDGVLLINKFYPYYTIGGVSRCSYIKGKVMQIIVAVQEKL